MIEKHIFNPQECGALGWASDTSASLGRLWGDVTLGFVFVNTAKTWIGLDSLIQCD